MQKYITWRILEAIISLLVVSAIVFFLVHASGDPLSLMLGENATEQDRAEVAAKMGMDRPLVIQYFSFLGGLVRGDFGNSLRERRPAFESFIERLPATLHLSGVAGLIAILIGIPAGILAALRRNGPLDILSRLFAVLGQAAPAYWVGLMLIWVFAVMLNLLPAGGRGGPQHVILPAITLGWFMSAGIVRLTRSTMIDVLGTDYVKVARSKGLSESTVVLVHAFKNAIIPVLTFASTMLVHILAGTVITETVFGWPGVGRLAYQAILNRDFPVVETVVISLAAMYVIANLMVDLLYGWIDPRVRYD